MCILREKMHLLSKVTQYQIKKSNTERLWCNKKHKQGYSEVFEYGKILIQYNNYFIGLKRRINKPSVIKGIGVDVL